MNPTLRCLLLSLLLAACGTPSKPVLPDGRNRMPINTAAHIDAYHSRQAATAAEQQPAPTTEQRIAQLERRLTALADAMAAAPAAGPCPGIAAGPSCGAADASRCLPDGLAANETMQCRTRSIVFSQAFAEGAYAFQPSLALRLLLLRAAGASQRIEVRGRTDADAFSVTDRLLALRRAASARAFLLQNGVDADRIHSTALASGGHLADNGTPAGKARNRRVDIEVMDIDPLAYSTINLTLKGAQHEPD